MNLYLRLFLLLFIRAFHRNKLDIFSPCSTNFRVSVFDLDANFHMNNGRYLTLMDLGRIDLMLKSKTFWKLILSGFYPVVNSQSIRFKRSLGPFQAFTMVTQIESWDDRDVFMTQKFICKKGSTVAEGYIKARFKQRGRKGSVPTSELFLFLDREYPGENLSALSKAQNQISELLTKSPDT